MRMRVLAISDETKEEAKKVIRYAEKNIITLSKTRLIKAGDLPPVGDNPNHTQHIHNGFRVVYSIEEKGSDTLVHHISISVNTKNKYPSIHAAKEILGLFNMSRNLEKDSLIIDEDLGDGFNAINIIQKKRDAKT